MNQPLFELCRTYLGAQLEDNPGTPLPREKTLPAITISRQAAAGAVTIARLLVDELNKNPEPSPWAVFDRNLVEKVLEDHELPQTLKRFMPEDAMSGVSSAV